MNDIKRCQKCGVIISDINTADYYRHIRVKYCSTCGPAINRLNAAERSKKVREQTRANNKLRRELNSELKKENELLLRQLEQAREMIEELKSYGRGKEM